MNYWLTFNYILSLGRELPFDENVRKWKIARIENNDWQYRLYLRQYRAIWLELGTDMMIVYSVRIMGGNLFGWDRVRYRRITEFDYSFWRCRGYGCCWTSDAAISIVDRLITLSGCLWQATGVRSPLFFIHLRNSNCFTFGWRILLE